MSGALFLAFAGLGGTASVIPAVLPSMAERHPGDTSTYLQAVPATFFGLLLGVLLSAYVMAIFSARRTVFLGSVLQASAVAAVIAATSPGAFVVATGLAGLGFGLVEAAGSVLARQVAGANVARLLAALTGTVAVMAAGCPLIVALVPWPQAPTFALGLVATLHLITAVGTARRPEPLAQPPTHGQVATSGRGGGKARLGRTAVALALYVGVEAVFSGWSAVIAADRLTLGARHAAVGTSAFWILMAAGRLAAWSALRLRAARTRHLVGAAVGASSCLLVAGTGIGGSAGSIAALCLAVFFLGPCYSLILGLGLARIDARAAERLTGGLVASGAVGGATIPFFALAAGQTSADPALFLGCAALLLLAAALVRGS